MLGYQGTVNGLKYRTRHWPHGKAVQDKIAVDFYLVVIDQKKEQGAALNSDGSNRLPLGINELQQRTLASHKRLVNELELLGVHAEKDRIYEELYSEVVSS